MRHRLLVFLLLLVTGCGPRASSPGETTPPDRNGWRQLARGMSQDQVRALLGEPRRIEEKEEVVCWHYQKGRSLERDAADPSQWVLPRGSLLFAGGPAGSRTLAEWREP